MGFLDKLFGRDEQAANSQQQGSYNPNMGQPTRRFANGQPQQLTDAQAVERYRYMLRTAPPETIEQAHAEAFAQLTPQQRQMALQQLSAALPANERGSAAYASDDPQTLARMATRAEMRQPGTLERTWNGGGFGGGGMGMGGMMAGSFLSTIAGVMVGSMIANAFFDSSPDYGNDTGGDGDYGNDSGQDVSQDGGSADYGNDMGGSFGDGGSSSSDFGGDGGGFDMGGGDFGGDF